MDLGGFGKILGSQLPPHPYFLVFSEKKRGSREQNETSRILVSTVELGRRPLMSLQDMSLGQVWKCVALTRQAAGFRPGAAYLWAHSTDPPPCLPKLYFFVRFSSLWRRFRRVCRAPPEQKVGRKKGRRAKKNRWR